MTEHDPQSSDGHDDIIRADNHERLFELSAIGIFRSTPAGRYLMANPAGVRMHGYSSEAELLRAVRNVGDEVYVDPGNRQTISQLLEEHGSVEGYECQIYRHKTKEPIWVRQNIYLATDAEGRPWYLDGFVEDITESKRVEEALRKARDQLARGIQERTAALQDSEEKYRSLVDGSVQGVIVHQNNRIAYANAAVAAIHGYDLDEMIGLPVQRLFSAHEQSRIAAYRESRAEDHVEFQALRPNGELVWVEGYSQNIQWDGAPARQDTFINIEARKTAQDALAASQQRFRTIIDHAPASIILKDNKGRIELVNRTYEIFFNTSAESVLGKTASDLYAPEAAERLDASERKVIKTGKILIEDFKVTQPEVPVEFLRITKFPVFDQSGNVSGVGTFAADISAEKAAEARLVQSQKMEAIGQLTGGVAHDFNNMLAAIIGNLELIQYGGMEATFNEEGINIALQAAHRGAELTRRLLAFSRQQELEGKVIDINQMLPQFGQLAQRTIGEDVAVEMKLAANLWPTMVDAGQLENALLNLVINARDAMPNGGPLIIETANQVFEEDDTVASEDLAPGDYVMIAVNDSGTGMPPDVRERVFEPFFTTKDVGQGTGLGLSMVFGFAKQSGGHVSIYSEVGEGTTVRIYLPRAEKTTNAERITAPAEKDRPTGDEMILVVEDDEAVRKFLVIVLRQLGYGVQEAEDGPAALAVMAASGPFDLLLTDVILPRGMSGRDVATAFGKHYPSAGVIYSSGYTREILNHRGQLAAGAALMNKPYQAQALAQRVREVLDRRT